MINVPPKIAQIICLVLEAVVLTVEKEVRTKWQLVKRPR
jgi:hypothetical protein